MDAPVSSANNDAKTMLEDLPFVDDSPGSCDEPAKCGALVTQRRCSPDKQQEPPLTFIEQICQLPGADQVEALYVHQQQHESHETRPVDPPEILVAYMSGQPEAVAAIELLREAQRIWDQRKRSPSPPEEQQSSLLAPVHQPRRFSHDDLRIPKITEETVKKSPASPPKPHTNYHQQYKRRPSTQVECLASHARYQKNPTGRKRQSLRPDELSPPNVQKKEMTARLRSARGSVDVVSQAMMTAGMNSGAYQSRRSSSLPESACLKVGEPGSAAGSRRPSHHRAALDADNMLPLGTDAASFYKEQRRRASSRASAIFLVSPSSKETQLVPEDEDDGTPEGRRRRRTISIIATVGAFLLVLSILLVTITLRLATHIDDLVRKENELQTSIASNGVDLGLFNVTTPLPPPSVGDHLQNASASAPPVGMLNATRGSGAT